MIGTVRNAGSLARTLLDHLYTENPSSAVPKLPDTLQNLFSSIKQCCLRLRRELTRDYQSPLPKLLFAKDALQNKSWRLGLKTYQSTRFNRLRFNNYCRHQLLYIFKYIEEYYGLLILEINETQYKVYSLFQTLDYLNVDRYNIKNIIKINPIIFNYFEHRFYKLVDY